MGHVLGAGQTLHVRAVPDGPVGDLLDLFYDDFTF
jgi:hypothetical protein